MLEAYKHEVSLFVTLTYADEDLPCDGSVSLRDVQLFMKLLRYRMEMEEPPRKVRYYIVGEYGDVGLRPHYHAVLFGMDAKSLVHIGLKMKGECSCSVCVSWQRGGVFIGGVSPKSAGYVVSYMLKDQKAPPGLKAEFAVMSRGRVKGDGLGGRALTELINSHVDQRTGEIFLPEGDVALAYRAERKRWPLGRYLRAQVRDKVGGDKDISRFKRINELYVKRSSKEGRQELENRREASKSQADYKVGFIRRKREKI